MCSSTVSPKTFFPWSCSWSGFVSIIKTVSNRFSVLKIYLPSSREWCVFIGVSKGTCLWVMDGPWALKLNYVKSKWWDREKFPHFPILRPLKRNPWTLYGTQWKRCQLECWDNEAWTLWFFKSRRSLCYCLFASQWFAGYFVNSDSNMSLISCTGKG